MSLLQRGGLFAPLAPKWHFSGVVGFTTCLTGWIDNCWFSVISIVCVAAVGTIGICVVGVRVWLTTAVVIVVVSTFFVGLSVVFSRLS